MDASYIRNNVFEKVQHPSQIAKTYYTNSRLMELLDCQINF